MKPSTKQGLDGEGMLAGALREFRVVLARVTDALDRGDSTQSATAPLAAFIQHRVACSVVTFWSLVEQDGESVMCRIGGYDARAGAALDEPLVRPVSDFDLKTLAESAICIVAFPTPPDNAGASCAAQDTPTARTDDTFIPACIDATIAANGETFGLVRCEFLAPKRAWKLAETTLLRSFAGEIALRRARRRARRD